MKETPLYDEVAGLSFDAIRQLRWAIEDRFHFNQDDPFDQEERELAAQNGYPLVAGLVSQITRLSAAEVADLGTALEVRFGVEDKRGTE